MELVELSNMAVNIPDVSIHQQIQQLRPSNVILIRFSSLLTAVWIAEVSKEVSDLYSVITVNNLKRARCARRASGKNV